MHHVQRHYQLEQEVDGIMTEQGNVHLCIKRVLSTDNGKMSINETPKIVTFGVDDKPFNCVSNCSILPRNVCRYRQIWEDERK